MKKPVLFLLSTLISFQTFAADECRIAISKSSFEQSGPISTDWVEKMKKKTPSTLQNRMNEAVQNAGFTTVAFNREILENHNTNYTNELPLGCVTSQSASGRCWIFAGNNMLRAELINSKKTDKDFSLSHTYMHFFNMLEKSNRWLWNAEEAQLQDLTRAEELKFIESDPFGDGGWYQWYQFLSAKYGMVPSQAMPDTEGSLNTAALNNALKTILSGAGVKIKALTKRWNSKTRGAYTSSQKNQLSRLREETMEKIFRILETHIGTPPSEFKYTNNMDKTQKSYTPASFRDSFVEYKPDDYVTISNNSRQPRNQFYEFKRSTIGVPDASGENYPVQALNLSFHRMDQLIRKSIDDGRPMWFATDVRRLLEERPSSPSRNATGIWHLDIYKYAEVFGMNESDFNLSSKDQSEFHLSVPTHAMTIVAYDKPDYAAQTIKYKIENSWDKKWADGGYGHMYLGWAEVHLAEIVVHKSMLTERELALIDAGAKVIEEVDFY